MAVADGKKLNVGRREVQFAELLRQRFGHRQLKRAVVDLAGACKRFGQTYIPDEIALRMTDEITRHDEVFGHAVIGAVIGEHARVIEVNASAIHGVERNMGRSGGPGALLRRGAGGGKRGQRDDDSVHEHLPLPRGLRALGATRQNLWAGRIPTEDGAARKALLQQRPCPNLPAVPMAEIIAYRWRCCCCFPPAKQAPQLFAHASTPGAPCVVTYKTGADEIAVLAVHRHAQNC
jgi:hypothetical protein